MAISWEQEAHDAQMCVIKHEFLSLKNNKKHLWEGGFEWKISGTWGCLTLSHILLHAFVYNVSLPLQECRRSSFYTYEMCWMQALGGGGGIKH